MALRGHASIQGSTDIPTLYNLLPGYIPMPHAHKHIDLDTFVGENAGAKGFWGNMRAYTVSMLKSWWGDAATAENDFCFDYLPRLTGTHDSTDTVERQINEGGWLLPGRREPRGGHGQRPHAAGRPGESRLAGGARPRDDRERDVLEGRAGDRDRRDADRGHRYRGLLLPAANHAEKQGSFTNTQRLLQWHRKALDPPGDARSDLWFYFHLGRILKEKLAGSTDERDRPLLDLVWDYPMEPGTDEPDAVAVLAEINGTGPDGQPLSMYTQLRDDGSTRCGCWIYCGVYGDGVNQADRRRSRHEQGPVAPDWGWAWPANRRVLYNRASADPDGKPWSERKAFVWWDPDANDGAGRWTGHDVPDFEADKPPTYRAPEGARAEDAINGTEPFIMQNDGRAWLYAPVGLLDGPMPTHYEPPESPLPNPLYPQQSNPARMPHPGKFNRYTLLTVRRAARCSRTCSPRTASPSTTRPAG
ncbi:molybdopterin-dependent oxidoreductase [Rhodococcus hoagii]|nr:molybdopterin-dependent oxidoreductase [Prescottella equi]